ncbi:hypothetical protein HDU99_003586, partial [Rhizoclosmatium hyalinum]
ALILHSRIIQTLHKMAHWPPIDPDTDSLSESSSDSSASSSNTSEDDDELLFVYDAAQDTNSEVFS